VLVHQNEVRGLYAEGLLGRWEGGRVAAKVRLPDDRAKIATDGEQFLVWKGKTAWLVDGDCRVVWKAEFANRLAIGEGFALGVRCGADRLTGAAITGLLRICGPRICRFRRLPT
jgi:hypothetical protein